MTATNPIEFFESQFQRQVQEQELALNPFEQAALEHVSGAVLDLGCGLGNLALALARRGSHVIAVDASPTAIEHINLVGKKENLPIEAVQADLEKFHISGDFDTVIAIGLLMFFSQERALELLADIQAHVKPGGSAIITVLAEGTTFLGMFQPGHYYLFGLNELEERFAGWNILQTSHKSFPAPGETTKEFVTVIAQKI